MSKSDDTISRQDAIEAVRKVWYDNDEHKNFKQRYYEMGNNDAVEDAIGYIDALPSAEPRIECIEQIRIDRDDMEDLVNEKVNEIFDKMAEPKAGWIPVSERLPKECDGHVLVSKEDGQVTTGLHSEFSNVWYIGDMCGVGGCKVTAWMPLPEPYKEGEA